MLVGTMSVSSCKKFLDVDSVSQQSGNNYWQTSSDFDKYMMGIYSNFRRYTMQSSLLFFPATGDFRCGPYKKNREKYNDRFYLDLLPNNDLRNLITNYNFANGFRGITDWSSFYGIVASCNILIEKVHESTVLSEKQKGSFEAEAVFMRDLCYFIMVRMFGDIPYYTEAYRSKPSHRENMVDVLNRCLVDLGRVAEKLPWTYDDPAFKGIRAQRGAVYALMMHMNMWNAGFDSPNKRNYYLATYDLGNKLMDNGGVYKLLPIEDFRKIFRGGSDEGLFEIPQSFNKGETFSLFSTYADNFLKFPHKRYTWKYGEPSECYTTFTGKFFEEMFPSSTNDKRKVLWFAKDNPNKEFTLECLKYTNIYGEEGEDVNPDDYQIVFRLSDAILLQAEAAEGLNMQDKAIELLDLIRRRAGAEPYMEGEVQGRNLSDAIWMERVKELIGEGHYFFDLVRTKRILDNNFTQHPMSAEAFIAGAWTWPIHTNALKENPGMRLNEYWTK